MTYIAKHGNTYLRSENKILSWPPETTGYIPTMSGNNTPSTFTASADREMGGSDPVDRYYPYRAFNGNNSDYYRSGLGAESGWLKITLPESISIWKFYLKAEFQPFDVWTVNRVQLVDDSDNVLWGPVQLSSDPTEYTVVLSPYSKKSSYFKLNFIGFSGSPTDVTVYTFQIYKII